MSSTEFAKNVKLFEDLQNFPAFLLSAIGNSATVTMQLQVCCVN